jgi:hypothetical protein
MRSDGLTLASHMPRGPTNGKCTLLLAASDAHHVTRCCIQEPCIPSGKDQKSSGFSRVCALT